jgi:hypothetical protein
MVKPVHSSQVVECNRSSLLIAALLCLVVTAILLVLLVTPGLASEPHRSAEHYSAP